MGKNYAAVAGRISSKTSAGLFIFRVAGKFHSPSVCEMLCQRKTFTIPIRQSARLSDFFVKGCRLKRTLRLSGILLKLPYS